MYAPGGTATYPSSILMTSVLAEIAGVNEIILAFPPSDEKVTNLMLACCHIGGVTEQLVLEEHNQLPLWLLEQNQ